MCRRVCVQSWKCRTTDSCCSSAASRAGNGTAQQQRCRCFTVVGRMSRCRVRSARLRQLQERQSKRVQAESRTNSVTKRRKKGRVTASALAIRGTTAEKRYSSTSAESALPLPRMLCSYSLFCDAVAAAVHPFRVHILTRQGGVQGGDVVVPSRPHRYARATRCALHLAGKAQQAAPPRARPRRRARHVAGRLPQGDTKATDKMSRCFPFFRFQCVEGADKQKMVRSSIDQKCPHAGKRARRKEKLRTPKVLPETKPNRSRCATGTKNTRLAQETVTRSVNTHTGCPCQGPPTLSSAVASTRVRRHKDGAADQRHKRRLCVSHLVRHPF